MSRKTLHIGMLAAAAALLSAEPAFATKLDLAVVGANYPAWSTLGECRAERSGQGCFQFHPGACGWEIYTTKAIGRQIAYAYNDGKKVDINTIKNGRFDKHICVLRP